MDAKDLGKRIRALRKLARLTQESLAAKADIGLRGLQEIEAGNGNPELSTILAIARALNHLPYELMTELSPLDDKLDSFPDEAKDGIVRPGPSAALIAHLNGQQVAEAPRSEVTVKLSGQDIATIKSIIHSEVRDLRNEIAASKIEDPLISAIRSLTPERRAFYLDQISRATVRDEKSKVRPKAERK